MTAVRSLRAKAGPAAPALQLGIDEAGRGPILGPMVLAAVALSDDAAATLAALGVTDSKRFGAGAKAHATRSALVQEVQKLASHIEVVVIEVAEIDARTRRHELNRLEQEVAQQLILRAVLPVGQFCQFVFDLLFALVGTHLGVKTIQIGQISGNTLQFRPGGGQIWPSASVFRHREKDGVIFTATLGGGGDKKE